MDPFTEFDEKHQHKKHVSTGGVNQEQNDNFYKQKFNTKDSNPMRESKSKFRIKRHNSIGENDDYLMNTQKDQFFNTQQDQNIDQFNITFRNLEVTTESNNLNNTKGVSYQNTNQILSGTGTLDLSKPSLQINKKNKIVTYNLNFDHLENPISNKGSSQKKQRNSNSGTPDHGYRLYGSNSNKNMRNIPPNNHLESMKKNNDYYKQEKNSRGSDRSDNDKSNSKNAQ